MFRLFQIVVYVSLRITKDNSRLFHVDCERKIDKISIAVKSKMKKRLCVALSMHHLLMVLSVAKEKKISLDEFHYFIIRSGADYVSLIEKIFPNVKVAVVPRFVEAGVIGRASEIKRTAIALIRSLNLSSEEVEIWIPNKTYHITNFLLYHLSVVKILGYEDGAGAYVDSGVLEWKSGLRIAAKKILSIIYFFPAYKSFRGVSKFRANEYWSLSSAALFPMQSNLISKKNYMDAVEQALLYVPRVRLECIEAFPNGPYLIVAGQPLSEGGFCSEQESIQIFEELADKISKTNISFNFVLYIPHPAELDELASERVERFAKRLKRSEIGYKLHPNDISIELFIKALATRGFETHLVSMLSTALYTSRHASYFVKSYYYKSRFVPYFPSLVKVFSEFGVVDIDAICGS